MPKSQVNPVAERVLHRLHAYDEARSIHGLVPSKGLPATTRRFAADHSVYHQGQPATHFFEVTSGVLMLSKMTEDGRRHVVEIVPVGWICGFSAGGCYDASCDALTDTIAISYKRTDVEKAESTQDRQRFLHGMERQICALHDHGLLLSRKSAEERVAAFLMRFVPGRGVPHCAGPALTNDDAGIEVPMGGREIGDFLGLNAETVSRAITKLERGGLITRVEGKRNNYHIIDVCRLCQAAHNDCGLASQMAG
nr:MAG: Crp/Fnr family transcriptional regulator [Hyphomicrobiales bacterium]